MLRQQLSRAFVVCALFLYGPAHNTKPATTVVPPPISREFRGVWLSPVSGADWPSHPGLPPDSQRAELLTLLDGAQAAGINAVMLHVRTAADAFYPTSRAPWSAYLTGQSGRAPDPFYDPLAFAITEAHKRGIELHAWVNPFRAKAPDLRTPTDPAHVINAHPGWIVKYGSQTWIDPGLPQAREAVLQAITEIVQRYDVDGIHLDDYFYPYLEDGVKPFADGRSWKRYGEAKGWTSRADWRRNNINEFVAELYRRVKRTKPWVAVGISPFGIWKPEHPQGITGLNSYAEIFSDSREWLRSGWVDYLAPQLYWPIDGKQDRFRRLDEWWREQNVMHRYVWPGLQTTLEARSREGWPSGEIARQIDLLRASRDKQSAGNIQFRMKSALRVPLPYDAPALTPAMPWLDPRQPATPSVRVLDSAHDSMVLRINAGGSLPVRWFAVQTRAADGRWTLRLREPASRMVVPNGDAVAVTAVSRTGVASEPVTVLLP